MAPRLSTWPRTWPKRLRAILHWLTPLAASVVLYGAAYSVSRWVFDVRIQWERVPYDFALLLGIAYLLFWASRRIWAYLLLSTVLVGVAYIGSAAKITYLDRPIMPEDIYNVSALFRILGAWGWLIVAFPLAAIAGLLGGLADDHGGEVGQTYMRHNVSNLTIQFESQWVATGAAYWFVISDNGLWRWGRYRDTYRREGDGPWLFARRRVRADPQTA